MGTEKNIKSSRKRMERHPQEVPRWTFTEKCLHFTIWFADLHVHQHVLAHTLELLQTNGNMRPSFERNCATQETGWLCHFPEVRFYLYINSHRVKCRVYVDCLTIFFAINVIRKTSFNKMGGYRRLNRWQNRNMIHCIDWSCGG